MTRILYLFILFQSIVYTTNAQDCLFSEPLYDSLTFAEDIALLTSANITIQNIQFVDYIASATVFVSGTCQLFIRPLSDFEDFFDLPVVQESERTQFKQTVLVTGALQEDNTHLHFSVWLCNENCTGYMLTSTECTTSTTLQSIITIIKGDK